MLGLVDHGMGLESSNVQDTFVVEDLKRLEVIESFINNEEPRSLNSKIDNALLGVTSIRSLLKEHDTTLAALEIPRITKKLKKLKRNSKRDTTDTSGALYETKTMIRFFLY